MSSDQCKLQHVSITSHTPSVYHGMNKKEYLIHNLIRTAILKLHIWCVNFISYFHLVIFSAPKKKKKVTLTNKTVKFYLFHLFTLKFLKMTYKKTIFQASLLLPKNPQRKNVLKATLDKSRKQPHKVASMLWHISLL